jgi:hypothetical protein
MAKKVMIRCIATKRQVFTGISMDPACFATAKLDNNSVSCPECQAMHGWAQSDAFFE